MPTTADSIAINFEVGDIANTVRGIGDMASAMTRLGQASGGALQPIHNPFDAVLTGLSALPNVAGKTASALRLLTGAVEGLLNAANAGAQRQLDFSGAQRFLGSDAKTTAIIEGLGKAVGVDSTDLAHSLRQRATGGDPFAMQAAAKLGYPFTPNGLPMDEGKALLQAAEALRQIAKNNPDEANRLAKNLDPRLIKLLSIPDDAWQSFKNFESGRVGQFGSQAEAAAAAQALNMQQLRERAADFLNGGGPGNVHPSLVPNFSRGGSLHQQNDSLKRNTQAIQENTEAVSKLSGIYGGGSRARSAIPRAFQGRGDALEQQLKNEKAKFGAFGVGQ